MLNDPVSRELWRREHEKFASRINALADLPDIGPMATTSSPAPDQSAQFDWRHEVVARSLAQADGHDPDLKVVDVKQAKAGPFGSVAASAVQPAWHLYLAMASGIVSALAGASERR